MARTLGDLEELAVCALESHGFCHCQGFHAFVTPLLNPLFVAARNPYPPQSCGSIVCTKTIELRNGGLAKTDFKLPDNQVEQMQGETTGSLATIAQNSLDIFLWQTVTPRIDQIFKITKISSTLP